jgi:hypothetical protein
MRRLESSRGVDGGVLQDDLLLPMLLVRIIELLEEQHRIYIFVLAAYPAFFLSSVRNFLADGTLRC